MEEGFFRVVQGVRCNLVSDGYRFILGVYSCRWSNKGMVTVVNPFESNKVHEIGYSFCLGAAVSNARRYVDFDRANRDEVRNRRNDNGPMA